MRTKRAIITSLALYIRMKTMARATRLPCPLSGIGVLGHFVIEDELQVKPHLLLCR